MIVRHCDNCGKDVEGGLYLKVAIRCEEHLVVRTDFPEEGDYCSAKCVAEKYEGFP